MAEPKTEIDRRFDRIENAIDRMVLYLVSSGALTRKYMEGINDILYDRTEAAPEGSTEQAE